MKNLNLCLFLVLTAFSSLAQDWIRYFGYGLQPHSTYCTEHYDKGYLLAGDINSYKYGWLIKTDINGNELWNIKIGDGINQTSISDVENTMDNGLVLCGNTSIYHAPYADPFIIRLNCCGDIEWCKVLIYDNTGDFGIRVKQTMDGGYILCAILYGDNPNNIVHLFKFDSGGDLFWHKIYNGDSLVHSEFIRDLIVDQQFCLLTGDCYYPNWLKPYYIQTDTSGNETWILAYGQHLGSGFIGDAWATVRDKHGNYYSAGSRNDTYPELIKFSDQGQEIMYADVILNSTDAGSRIILLYNDTTCIIDAGWLVNGTPPGYYALLKTDTLGVTRKIKYLPDPDNSGSTWATKTFDSKILLNGINFVGGTSSRIVLSKFNSDLEYDSVYTRPFIYDSLCPHPIVSDTIMPSCIIVGLEEPLTNPETATLKVFPNPANQKITVELPKYVVVRTGQSGSRSTTIYHHWKSTTLEVYDLSGKKIFEREIIRAENSLEINVSGWQPGMYYFRLVYNKGTVADTKVVIQ